MIIINLEPCNTYKVDINNLLYKENCTMFILRRNMDNFVDVVDDIFNSIMSDEAHNKFSNIVGNVVGNVVDVNYSVYRNKEHKSEYLFRFNVAGFDKKYIKCEVIKDKLLHVFYDSDAANTDLRQVSFLREYDLITGNSECRFDKSWTFKNKIEVVSACVVDGILNIVVRTPEENVKDKVNIVIK